MDNLIPIERKQGVTIYGRIIGPNGKLGQYEVHSEHLKYDGFTYSLYKDAQTKMGALIGVKHGNINHV